jgi:hypothetical protein
MDLNGACAIFSFPPSRKTDDSTQDTLSSTPSRSTLRVVNSTHLQRSSPQMPRETCFPSANSSSRSTHVVAVRTSCTLLSDGRHWRLRACGRSGRSRTGVHQLGARREARIITGGFEVRGFLLTDRPFCSTRLSTFVVTTRLLMMH